MGAGWIPADNSPPVQRKQRHSSKGPSDWTNGVRSFPISSGLEGFVVTDGYPGVVWLVMIGVGAIVGAVGSGTAASKFLDV